MSLLAAFMGAEEMNLRQEEARLKAQLYGAQVKHYEAQSGLVQMQQQQAVQHQQRLAQAFLPGEQPGVPAPPQARVRPLEAPGAVPPAPTEALTGPGDPPRPQPPDAPGALQDFARRYGPQPGVVSSTPPAVVGPASEQPTLEPSSVPTVPTGASRLPTEPPSPLGPSGGHAGASAVQPIPPGQGEQRTPLPMPATRVTATGPDDTAMLRAVSKSYFLASKPQEALAIWKYAEEQQQLRNLGGVYRSVMSDPGASEPQRRIALAGLGAALMRAAKVEDGMKLLTDSLPLSDRQVIDKASVETRNVLLEQQQAGTLLDVGKANREAEARAVRRTNATREPQTQIIETEAGVYAVDKKSGVARPITVPSSPGTPGPSPTPSGTPQPLPGKRISEGQAKAYNYGTRALQANTILQDLEAQGVTGNSFAAYMAEQAPYIGGGLGAAGAAVLGIVTGGVGFAGVGAGTALGAGLGIALAEPLANLMRTPEEKLYAQARLDFLAAVLRKESGAAITNSEAAREEKRYFPMPGDSPAVIAQKRQARLQVLATLATEAGRPLALPQATPPRPPQTPGDVGIVPTPGGGAGTVRVPRPPATPAPSQAPRTVPGQLSDLLPSLSPAVILQVSDETLEGVTSPSDVPGLSVAQQRALLVRLARRAHQQPREGR